MRFRPVEAPPDYARCDGMRPLDHPKPGARRERRVVDAELLVQQAEADDRALSWCQCGRPVHEDDAEVLAIGLNKP